MLAQRSFEDLGTPLSDVTFCVLDLETTGGSVDTCAITEIGALKVKRGEVVGTFQTLVDPGEPVPAFIRLLTGICDEDLIEAPRVEAVLPSLLEFVSDSVIVAHNARFDVSFVNAALERSAYPPLSNRVLDTAKLARKILAGEVPNNKLSTLSGYLRCAHQPCHRAYQDVLATTDVLHHLIECVAGFGVTTLEDLIAMSATRIDGTFSKISLCDDLPRGIGVYRFKGGRGQTLYVGKATDLRSRVRSYFYGDPRRKIRDLLRETDSIDVETYPTMLEAEIAEARAIAAETPPYNRAGKRRGSWYLKVAAETKVPKISAARVPKDDGATYLGPLPSQRIVRTLIDALRDSNDIHRCAEPRRCNGCAFADLGRCPGNDPEIQRIGMRAIVSAITREPGIALQPLHDRMMRLARQERFEEAAELRERGALLERSLERSVEIASLVEAGDIVLGVGDRILLIRNGVLAGAAIASGDGLDLDVARLRSSAPPSRRASFLSPATQLDARVICSFLRRDGDGARLLYVSDGWSHPAAARPERRFAAKKTG